VLLYIKPEIENILGALTLKEQTTTQMNGLNNEINYVVRIGVEER